MTVNADPEMVHLGEMQFMSKKIKKSAGFVLMEHCQTVKAQTSMFLLRAVIRTRIIKKRARGPQDAMHLYGMKMEGGIPNLALLWKVMAGETMRHLLGTSAT